MEFGAKVQKEYEICKYRLNYFENYLDFVHIFCVYGA